MSKICQITGKKALVGNNVSHAMNKTKRRFEVNLIKKRFYLTDQEKWITLKLSTSALKTINRKGLSSCTERGKSARRIIIYCYGKKGNRVQVILECTEHKDSVLQVLLDMLQLRIRKIHLIVLS
ncbi:MAG: hypothetical protein CM15mP32_0600 [Flavobacteriaceae bacterium]|nr:MAG: hypothetical protein CM15mP32_0600 [Flavobacteriaceae bacterium]